MAQRALAVAAATLCVGTLLGTWTLLGGSANAAVLKGTVTFRGGAFGSDTSAADAVVVLHGPSDGAATSLQPGKAPPAAPHATIDQRKQRFIPRVLAVAAGTTVEFPNHDNVHHNVYSPSPAHRFDLGLYPPGETRSTMIERAGVVEIRCSAHSEMRAYVVVSDSPYHAAVSGQGAYRIDDVRPGAYEIEVWHPDFEPVRKPLAVPPNTPVLSVDLDLRTRRAAP